jgi:2-(3-amino-3-carboxypropyl)histidine synthase
MELDLSKALQEAKKRKAKKVALQVPEGLKTRIAGIVEEIEKGTGATVLTFIDPCFGACDIADERAKALGAELLVHFGHKEFVAKHAIDTVYIPVDYGAKAVSCLVEKLAKELGKKKLKNIALCSTAQYSKHVELAEKALKKKGFSVQGACSVLGCSYGCMKKLEKKIDAAVFVGDGVFHPIGLSFAVAKPVFTADPIESLVEELKTQRDLFLRKRIAMIEGLKQAKVVAIWVSTKKGQQKTALAESLKEKFEKQGKKALLLASDFINPDYMLGIKAEGIVCTACPRIALDDSSSYRQPIVNPTEALIALGEKRIEEYEFDELC